MQLSRPRIELIVSTQTVQLWDGYKLVRTWPCSTSEYGLGSQVGSYKTPLGTFRIGDKFGEGSPWNAMFKSRGVVGIWDPNEKKLKDPILARILRLEGLDEENKNTFDRYIYLHGTAHENKIGQPASHGCIRLRNLDVIELFDFVPMGTPMYIRE